MCSTLLRLWWSHDDKLPLYPIRTPIRTSISGPRHPIPSFADLLVEMPATMNRSFLPVRTYPFALQPDSNTLAVSALTALPTLHYALPIL